jgi:hypothetical protein
MMLSATVIGELPWLVRPGSPPQRRPTCDDRRSYVRTTTPQPALPLPPTAGRCGRRPQPDNRGSACDRGVRHERVLIDWDRGATESGRSCRPRNFSAPAPAGRWDGPDLETPVQRARPWSAKLATDLLDAHYEVLFITSTVLGNGYSLPGAAKTHADEQGSGRPFARAAACPRRRRTDHRSSDAVQMSAGHRRVATSRSSACIRRSGNVAGPIGGCARSRVVSGYCPALACWTDPRRQ